MAAVDWMGQSAFDLARDSGDVTMMSVIANADCGPTVVCPVFKVRRFTIDKPRFTHSTCIM